MRTPKGFRQMELCIPIGTHEIIKEIAKEDGISQGKIVNTLILLGIVKLREERAAAKAETVEPADEATGD